MIDLEPCYDFENNPECVDLAKNLPCLFTIGQEEFNCLAEVTYNVSSGVEVKTDIILDIRQFLAYQSAKSSVKCIILSGEKVPVIMSTPPLPSGQTGITFSPRKEPFPIVGNDETKISKVIFHLFDFKDEIGTSRKRIQIGNSFHFKGITELKSNKWKVELHETRKINKTDVLNNHLPALTHVGCLTRVDGSEFDGKTALRMLLDLRLFFTFSQGAFCSPEMPVGFDENENRVWVLGSSPNQPLNGTMSWFDSYHSDQLAQLFPHFISKMEDERWRETFHTVIYWYARSNNTSGSGIDTGIILTQIAIERLAYEYSLDLQNRDVQDDYFELKWASDKFRYLFLQLDIPLDIPQNFIKVKEIAAQEGFVDAPHFLTVLRNSMVHPDNNRRNLFKGLYYDAWRLGMWYLELAILGICNYGGTYFNRLSNELWVGHVEDVPWLK